MKRQLILLAFGVASLNGWQTNENIRANRKIRILTDLLIAYEIKSGKIPSVQFDGSDVEHRSCYSSSVVESVFLMGHLLGRTKRIEGLVLPINVDPLNPIENTYGKERPGGRVHEGIDLFAPIGTPVVSVAGGVVLFVGRDVLGGNIVKVLGGDNRIYYYAHLSRSQSPEPGSRVSRGQIIGFVGNSGNAMLTPPHLHFEILEILWVIPLITRSVNPYEELSLLSGGKNSP